MRHSASRFVSAYDGGIAYPTVSINCMVSHNMGFRAAI